MDCVQLKADIQELQEAQKALEAVYESMNVRPCLLEPLKWKTGFSRLISQS